jgi:hypothetical protein
MNRRSIFASSAPFVLTVLLAAMAAARSETQPRPCGTSPEDWCPAPPGDPCGRHHNVAACRADPSCYGMPYQGESVIACQLDARGFALNCPTVGCTSTRPQTGGQ